MKRGIRRGLAAVAVIMLWIAGSLVMHLERAASVDSGAPTSGPTGPTTDPTTDPTTEPSAASPGADYGADDRADDGADATSTPRPERSADLGVQLSAHSSGRIDYADKVMQRLQEAGAQWVRVDVGWATLQPGGPGTFANWYANDIDQVLASARQHDLKVIFAFWMTPAWASPDGHEFTPPSDVNTYAAAIERAAQRWQHLVDAWEVWNEPNLDSFFTGADPATYARLLCAAYPAVKTYSDKPVIFGGLMFNDADWLDRAYQAGAQGCFDALGTHPYVGPSDGAPETPSVGAKWRLTSTPAMHEVMTKWGDGAKRIWITELGWSTGPVNDGNPWQRPVSTARQADFLRRAVELIRSEYPYVGPIIWYRDVDGPTRRYEDGFGLMHADLTDKPAMKAFRRAVRTS